MHGIDKRIVYVIRSDFDPSRHYVGITNDLAARLQSHNTAPGGHTVANRPWSLVVSLEFPSEKAAVRFEKYLKTGSGRAFAKRHFALPINRSESAMLNSKPSANDQHYQEFARRMRLVEDGPSTTQFQQLSDSGVELPAPDSLDDAQVSATLWDVIHGLARLRTYLAETDHLSDRELYTQLWADVLREEVPAIDEIGFSHHVNLLSNGGNRETTLYLKYFADDEFRRGWAERFPDYAMPAPEERPYDRDRRLPQLSSDAES